MFTGFTITNRLISINITSLGSVLEFLLSHTFSNTRVFGNHPDSMIQQNFGSVAKMPHSLRMLVLNMSEPSFIPGSGAGARPKLSFLSEPDGPGFNLKRDLFSKPRTGVRPYP